MDQALHGQCFLAVLEIDRLALHYPYEQQPR